ncbi:MAG TPA: tetratricopeptide repeat protein [Streptosporangiaceae bacterium]|nr:tetratricopeptide repeat protein [Streptosporangiaceae bacterium]
MVTQQAGTVTSSGSGVLLSGTVPPLADAYYPREQSGPDLISSLRPGQTVVLVHGEETGQAARVPAAQGGTGKTQLAVEFTHAMWNNRTVEILIWVNAASRESVITGFAQAANTVDASQPDEGAETAAARFVSWLAHTRRPWALVIDDLAELSDLEDLWPAGASGRVLITSRLPASAFEDAVAEGGLAQGSTAEEVNLRVVRVPGLNRREALDYVTSRLSDYPDQRIEALDLGEDLDGLPLALAQATAAMSVRRQGCREYRALLAERIGHMPAVPGASAAVLATWSIAAECAHELPPAGLAWPALVLAAMLDHHGVPGAVLTSPASCGYIAGRPSTANAADQNMVRAAINNLAQAGLVTIDPVSPVRTVQMHASVQAAVRSYLPAADLEQVVLAAADALLETWPDGDGDSAGTAAVAQGPFQQAQLEQALRDCAATLRASDGGLLWKPEAHPLLFRAGLSLEHSRLSEAAITYWKSMVATSTRLLGPAHANAVVARDRLAAAYEAAGKSADAIAVFQTALAEREQHQGAEHPETIAARAHLAHAYQSAGRPADAISLYERTVADSARLLGAAHPVTLDARASLAETYQASGEPREAIAAYEALLADAEHHLGVGHPTTLGARASLGAAYGASGRAKDAIGQFQRALSDHERMHGPVHPDTIAARASLASAYRSAGKQKDAIGQYDRVLTDRERISGADHPDTIAARANLAYAYRSAGRLREAVPLYERTLADRMRVQGADHRDTLTARSNLAACYQQARRLTDAIPQYEKALADSERMLGPGDTETLTTRCNLASAYYTAGRLTDVVAVLQRALTDCERYLGPDHQMTDTVRANLEAATQV